MYNSRLITFYVLFYRQLRSAARALLYNVEKIPEEKKEILRTVVLENYPNELEITNELLNEAADIDIM